MGNISFYVHDLRTSGVLRDTMMVANHIARRHHTTVIAGYGDGFFRAEAERGGYRLEILSASPGEGASKVQAAIRLRQLLHRHPADIVVSMGNLGHATPYLGCWGRTRRIYRISNEVSRGDGLRGWLRARWMKMLMKDATRMPAVGGALRHNPMFANAFASGLAVEIASGVDFERANRLALAPSPHFWFGEHVPVIIGIGRLRPQKNFDLMIDAVSRVRRHQRVRLVIVGGGTGEERARLGRLADAVGIGPDFLLAGETDNVFAWAARAAVFVLSSRWEGSSLALLEALAVGTPVVASALAGDAAEVLGDGRHGLLFDGNDAAALADAIRIQLSDGTVRPGRRALDYGLTADVYAGLIEAALDRPHSRR